MNLLKACTLSIIFCGVMLLSGCGPLVENNRIEEIAPVIFWSIEEAGDGRLKISTLVPPLTKEKKQMLSQKVDLQKEAQKAFNLTYYREVKTGQLRMLFISEGLARKGVSTLLNTVMADPNISQRVYLVVVKGNFEQYIRNQLDRQPDLDYFLYRMFKHYEEKNQGELTVVNLHQFVKRLYAPVADPVMPVFRVGKDDFKYEGTGVFRRDKLVGVLRGMEDQIFQLVDNFHYLNNFPIPELSVDLGHVHANPHITLDNKKSSLAIRVELKGRIEEYRGNKILEDASEIADMDNKIEAYLKEQTVKLIQKLQRWEVDPFKLGDISLTAFSKPMGKEEWSRAWSQMKIDIAYQLSLRPLASTPNIKPLLGE